MNKIRLLIGGSPCTYWSISQKNNRETTAEGIGWELFKNYLIAKEKFKPDYFLYENNKSAAQPIKDQISYELKAPLQYINSALVSAQSRQRFYCHNIPGVPQPKDRGILLKDILESRVSFRNEKGYCLDVSYYKGGNLTSFNKQSGQRLQVAEPVRIPPYGNNDKARPVNARYSNNAGLSFEKRIYSGNSNKQQIDYIAEPIRVGNFGKGNQQSKRIYSIDGKSTTINAGGGGQGAKTGLYACPVNPPACMKYERTEYAKLIRKDYESGALKERRCNLRKWAVREDNKSNTLTTVLKDNMIIEYADGTTKPIYEVLNGLITIKDKQYPIKLPDGYYIIRKLTVLECKRLQTVRDNYIMPCSASQNYKMLGNGWTVDVIAHILSHIPGIADCEVEVLSMYDGMSCGNLALEKLGCKISKYISYEIDKYAIQTTQTNFPYVIQKGDAFGVRQGDWGFTNYDLRRSELININTQNYIQVNQLKMF